MSDTKYTKPSKYLSETHEGGSPRGYHFYGMYAQCQRKFYLCNYLCLKPCKLGKSLMLGKAIHCGFQAFYEQDFNSDIMLPAFYESMDQQYELFLNTEVYNEALESGEMMIKQWISDWVEYDRENYTVAEVDGVRMIEKELAVPVLDTGMTFTVRPDVVLRSKKTGKLHGFDHKHTGYSIGKSADNVMHQDQATAYMWAYKKMYGEEIEKYIPNILYRNKGVVKTDRSYPVYRDERALAEFERGICAYMTEVTQKMKVLEAGGLDSPEDVHYIFPRNPFCDGDGAWKCDYREVCRQTLLPGDVPNGYVYEMNKEVA